MLRGLPFWALGLAILAGGALLVCPGGPCMLDGLDRAGLGLAHALRSEPLDRLMRGATWLGSLVLLVPLVGLVGGVLYRGGRRREAGFVMLSLLGATAWSQLAKLWVARPRPDLFPALAALPESGSYPSAHAMQATAVALALCYVARRQRARLALFLAAAALLAGFSRVYLQVHFPSDVVAGMLVGALWVAGLRAASLPRG